MPMPMSTYVPSVIDEGLYEQTKKDAVAAFAPEKSAFIAGGLAGAVATWLPAIVIYPIVFFYKYKIGAKVFMTGAEKWQAAVDWLGASLGQYATWAVWLMLVLAAYGVLAAKLRRKSAREDRYMRLHSAKHGLFQMGLDAQLTAVGFPVLIIIGLFLAQRLDMVIVGLVIIVFTGVVYQMFWQKLQDFILYRVHRLGFEERTVMALRLMIPRTVGWKNARVENLEIDKAQKSAKITGEFASKDVEMDARNITEHYLRGYHPVYVVNNKTQE